MIQREIPLSENRRLSSCPSGRSAAYWFHLNILIDHDSGGVSSLLLSIPFFCTFGNESVLDAICKDTARGGPGHKARGVP